MSYNLAYICNLISQNQKLNQLKPPPNRIDNLSPAVNPYLQINAKTNMPYTQFDLNMRRKTEILKYSPNTQSSQTNSLTKSQKWAQIVTGKYQSESFVPIRTNNSDGTITTTINGLVVDITKPSIQIPTCNSKSDKPTLSTSCNVPGPPIELYSDPTVPLYNYMKNVDAFSIINSQNVQEYDIVNHKNAVSITNGTPTVNNLLQNTTTPVTISTIYIFNPTKDVTRFNLNIPVSVYFAGTLPQQLTTAISATVAISSLQLSVLYNGFIVNMPSDSGTVVTFPHGATVQFMVNPNVTTFYASYNIGNIVISNISLATLQGYIYDIQLSANMTSNLQLAQFISLTCGCIMNPDMDISNNCSAKVAVV